MSVCDYCQREIQKFGVCPHCGTTQYTAGGKIIYGATAKDSCGCEVAITEKYLIIRKVSGAESKGAAAGRAFGLLGVLVADVASQKVRPHGFYELSNFKKAIFPYRTNDIKKKNAIKLFTNDGKDFILIFDKPGFVDGTAKVLKTMVEKIRAAIPLVEDGSGTNFGTYHCMNPYVTLDTFDKVKPGYTAPSRPVSSANTQQSRPQPTPQPTPQPNNQGSQTAHQATQTQSAPSPTTVRCPHCGKYVLAKNKFCTECGNKMVKEKKCLRCGKILEETEKFCGECGYQVK